MDHVAPGTWMDERTLAVAGTAQAYPGEPHRHA